MALSSCAFIVRPFLPPWLFMWCIAVAIFVGFKWWTWIRAVKQGIATTGERSIAYLFLWAGMDARRFLDLEAKSARPKLGEFLFALAKMALGAVLLGAVARLAGSGWVAGWIGMIGLIFILHFGLFHLMALIWQTLGIDAQPLMDWPILANSLSDFWSKRWNSGFRDLAFGLLFARLVKTIPARGATLLVFAVSGVIHELVITVPMGTCYGLPTCYFMLQGLGLLIERSPLVRPFRRTFLARAFAGAVIVLPVGWLFPPAFVLRIMVPFFQYIHALS